MKIILYNICKYVNMKKTKVMWFERNEIDRYNVKDFNFIIDDTILSRVCNYQYLGVDLDSMLSYEKFLDSVVNKTTQKLHVFRKNQKVY